MDRATFNCHMLGEVRSLLTKHEKERKAVAERDAALLESKIHGTVGTTRVMQAEKAVTHAGDDLDMAIYAFSDRLYDIAKGEDV